MMRKFNPDEVVKEPADLREEFERSRCPACIGKRLHSEEEGRNHPYRGHGRINGKWTHPDMNKFPGVGGKSA